MENSVTSDTPSYAGFRSEEDKRRFVAIAGILGAVFFVVQFVGPMLIVLLAMPTFFFTGEVTRLDVTNAARSAGSLYLIETTTELRSERATSRLVRVAGRAIEGVAELEGWEPMLLGDEEQLWLVGPSRIARLVNGSVVPTELSEPLGDLCRPFFLEERPTVVENRPDGGRLLSWTGDAWEPLRELPLARGRCRFQPLPVEGSLWLFRRDGDTLYVQDTDAADPEWSVVLSEPDEWFAFSFAGRPAVASSGTRGFRVTVHDGARWRTVEDKGDERHVFLDELAAFPNENGSLTIVTGGFPGSMAIRDWSDGELGEPTRFGSEFPFPRHMMLIGTLPHLATMFLSLLLAVSLTALMTTHRITTYDFQGKSVFYASLVRRAFAQIADAAVVSAPLFFVFRAIFGTFTDVFDRGPDFRGVLVWLALVGLWTIGVFVAFSFTEGRFGVTPGKWLTGIRVVGTDLMPCGFARALLRNVLKFADGFFNYLVGILLVAFTPEWQRLGDMAARTIVIRREPGGRMQNDPSL